MSLGRKDWADEIEFALKEATSIVDGLADYFDYDYCDPILAAAGPQEGVGDPDLKCKSDQTGIPTFRSGAMENWGLITYRERLLLLDEERSGATDKEAVTDVMAHELAHQWFGDIVTMKWWNDLWLNEGKQ